MVSEFMYELFSDMPRQGPGSNECTRKAYKLLPNLPPQPNILDVSCGSGIQTLELARISEGQITALDNYQPYLDDLKKRAKKVPFFIYYVDNSYWMNYYCDWMH